LPPVTNFMNQDHFLLLAWFVNDAVVSFAIFEKPGEVTFQRFRLDLLKMLSEPSDLLDDSFRYRRIKLLKLPNRILQYARSEHA